jgi:hypothetical protein
MRLSIAALEGLPDPQIVELLGHAIVAGDLGKDEALEIADHFDLAGDLKKHRAVGIEGYPAPHHRDAAPKRRPASNSVSIRAACPAVPKLAPAEVLPRLIEIISKFVVDNPEPNYVVFAIAVVFGGIAHRLHRDVLAKFSRKLVSAVKADPLQAKSATSTFLDECAVAHRYEDICAMAKAAKIDRGVALLAQHPEYIDPRSDYINVKAAKSGGGFDVSPHLNSALARRRT